MSYIIGSPCVSVCDTACVHVCPVDAIHRDEETTIQVESNDSSVKKNYEFFGLTYESK